MSSKQPRTRTPSAEVTESLIEAARTVLEEQGSHALTVRAVAARAGVAPMGVYSRFGGKDGLLEALFVAGFSDLQEAIAAARGSDALSRLRNGCLAYRDFGVGRPHLYELMFREMLDLDLSAESLAQAASSFHQLVERVEDACAAGSVRAGDPVEIAQQLWNGLHGGVSLENAGVTFAVDPRGTFAAMVDTMLAGLAPRGGAGTFPGS